MTPPSEPDLNALIDAVGKGAKEYAESCDNESGSFLGRDLIKIREKSYRACFDILAPALKVATETLEMNGYGITLERIRRILEAKESAG